MEIDSIKAKLRRLVALYDDDDVNEDDIVYATFDYVRQAHTVAQLLLLEGRYPELQRCLHLCRAAFADVMPTLSLPSISSGMTPGASETTQRSFTHDSSVCTDKEREEQKEMGVSSSSSHNKVPVSSSHPIPAAAASLSTSGAAAGAIATPAAAAHGLGNSFTGIHHHRKRLPLTLSEEDKALFKALLGRTEQFQRQLDESRKRKPGRDTEYYIRKLVAASSNANGQTAAIGATADGRDTRDVRPPSPIERGVSIGRRTKLNRWKVPRELPPLVTRSKLFLDPPPPTTASLQPDWPTCENEEETRLYEALCVNGAEHMVPAVAYYNGIAQSSRQQQRQLRQRRRGLRRSSTGDCTDIAWAASDMGGCGTEFSYDTTDSYDGGDDDENDMNNEALPLYMRVADQDLRLSSSSSDGSSGDELEMEAVGDERMHATALEQFASRGHLFFSGGSAPTASSQSVRTKLRRSLTDAWRPISDEKRGPTDGALHAKVVSSGAGTGEGRAAGGAGGCGEGTGSITTASTVVVRRRLSAAMKSTLLQMRKDRETAAGGGGGGTRGTAAAGAGGRGEKVEVAAGQHGAHHNVTLSTRTYPVLVRSLSAATVPTSAPTVLPLTYVCTSSEDGGRAAAYSSRDSASAAASLRGGSSNGATESIRIALALKGAAETLSRAEAQQRAMENKCVALLTRTGAAMTKARRSLLPVRATSDSASTDVEFSERSASDPPMLTPEMPLPAADAPLVDRLLAPHSALATKLRPALGPTTLPKLAAVQLDYELQAANAAREAIVMQERVRAHERALKPRPLHTTVTIEDTRAWRQKRAGKAMLSPRRTGIASSPLHDTPPIGGSAATAAGDELRSPFSQTSAPTHMALPTSDHGVLSSFTSPPTVDPVTPLQSSGAAPSVLTPNTNAFGTSFTGTTGTSVSSLAATALLLPTIAVRYHGDRHQQYHYAPVYASPTTTTSAATEAPSFAPQPPANILDRHSGSVIGEEEEVIYTTVDSSAGSSFLDPSSNPRIVVTVAKRSERAMAPPACLTAPLIQQYIQLDGCEASCHSSPLNATSAGVGCSSQHALAAASGSSCHLGHSIAVPPVWDDGESASRAMDSPVRESSTSTGMRHLSTHTGGLPTPKSRTGDGESTTTASIAVTVTAASNLLTQPAPPYRYNSQVHTVVERRRWTQAQRKVQLALEEAAAKTAATERQSQCQPSVAASGTHPGAQNDKGSGLGGGVGIMSKRRSTVSAAELATGTSSVAFVTFEASRTVSRHNHTVVPYASASYPNALSEMPSQPPLPLQQQITTASLRKVSLYATGRGVTRRTAQVLAQTRSVPASIVRMEMEAASGSSYCGSSSSSRINSGGSCNSRSDSGSESSSSARNSDNSPFFPSSIQNCMSFENSVRGCGGAAGENTEGAAATSRRRQRGARLDDSCSGVGGHAEARGDDAALRHARRRLSHSWAPQSRRRSLHQTVLPLFEALGYRSPTEADDGFAAALSDTTHAELNLTSTFNSLHGISQSASLVDANSRAKTAMGTSASETLASTQRRGTARDARLVHVIHKSGGEQEEREGGAVYTYDMEQKRMKPLIVPLSLSDLQCACVEWTAIPVAALDTCLPLRVAAVRLQRQWRATLAWRERHERQTAVLKHVEGQSRRFEASLVLQRSMQAWMARTRQMRLRMTRDRLVEQRVLAESMGSLMMTSSESAAAANGRGVPAGFLVTDGGDSGATSGILPSAGLTVEVLPPVLIVAEEAPFGGTAHSSHHSLHCLRTSSRLREPNLYAIPASLIRTAYEAQRLRELQYQLASRLIARAYRGYALRETRRLQAEVETLCGFLTGRLDKKEAFGPSGIHPGEMSGSPTFMRNPVWSGLDRNHPLVPSYTGAVASTASAGQRTGSGSGAAASTAKNYLNSSSIVGTRMTDYSGSEGTAQFRPPITIVRDWPHTSTTYFPSTTPSVATMRGGTAGCCEARICECPVPMWELIDRCTGDVYGKLERRLEAATIAAAGGSTVDSTIRELTEGWEGGSGARGSHQKQGEGGEYEQDNDGPMLTAGLYHVSFTVLKKALEDRESALACAEQQAKTAQLQIQQEQRRREAVQLQAVLLLQRVGRGHRRRVWVHTRRIQMAERQRQRQRKTAVAGRPAANPWAFSGTVTTATFADDVSSVGAGGSGQHLSGFGNANTTTIGTVATLPPGASVMVRRGVQMNSACGSTFHVVHPSHHHHHHHQHQQQQHLSQSQEAAAGHVTPRNNTALGVVSVRTSPIQINGLEAARPIVQGRHPLWFDSNLRRRQQEARYELALVAQRFLRARGSDEVLFWKFLHHHARVVQRAWRCYVTRCEVQAQREAQRAARRRQAEEGG